tara:strand:- start:66 stop:500 length:435 start_codon:yes stop_codon:yes gene_type:complete
VNKNKIFDLFDNTQNTVDGIDNTKKKPPISKVGSYFNIGMFTKLISNHFIFHAKLQKFLKKEEPNYNVESTKEASEFVVFNRAFSYLKKVNPSSKEVIFMVLDFNSKILNQTLESALQYFEEEEEFEKCAHIFKFQKILKESKR